MPELARQSLAVLLIAVNVAMWIASLERREGRYIELDGRRVPFGE